MSRDICIYDVKSITQENGNVNYVSDVTDTCKPCSDILFVSEGCEIGFVMQWTGDRTHFVLLLPLFSNDGSEHVIIITVSCI